MTKLTLPTGQTIDVPEWAAVPGKYVAEFTVTGTEPYSQSWVLSEKYETITHGILYKLDGSSLDKRLVLQYGAVQLIHMQHMVIEAPLWAAHRFSMPVQMLRQAYVKLSFRTLVAPREPLQLKFFMVVSESLPDDWKRGTPPSVQVFDDAEEENELRAQQWRWE